MWEINTATDASASMYGAKGRATDAPYFAGRITGERCGLPGALTPVPEPSIIGLLGISLAFLGLRARRRYIR